MMILQLRTYTLQPGAMVAWRVVWQQHIKPIREGLGFSVPAAWEVPEKNQFVWLMAYHGDEDWATLDASFHASPERKAISPDPAGLIVSMETQFLNVVD